MPHGTHPIPATTTSARGGSLAIVPVAFLAGFHVLPLLTPFLSPGHRPLKAEIGGSSPLRVANSSSPSAGDPWAQGSQQHPHQLVHYTFATVN